MKEQTFLQNYFNEFSNQLRASEIAQLAKAGELIDSIRDSKSKVILAGNGGSAAIASHVAVDLTKAAGVRAVNFNEADLITCLANDYGYENWIAKALDFYADSGDLVILVSSSGQSPNILIGAARAKESNLKLITFSGFNSDNPLRESGDLNFWVDSFSYNIVEMTHQIWLLSIVDLLCLDANV